MTEALEKIQSLVQEAKTFALFSKKDSEDYKLLAGEALKMTLSEKKTSAISLPEHQEFKKKWGRLLPENKTNIFPQQTSIRIPKNLYKIKELSCEENEEFLSLVVTSENNKLSKEAIVFEPILPKIDAAFCFFEPHDIDALNEFEKNLILPKKEKIIFFTSNEKTFAEKIFQIIETISPESQPAISTLLFASLITETNNFVRPVNQEVLRFGSELLSSGADKETIKTILDKEKTISFARLLGRALARTHADEILDASWTFLSRKDLEKTENLNFSPSFLYDIARNLRNLIPFRSLSLLFWHSNDSVFAMAVADEENKLVPLARHLGVSLQSRFFTAGPFNSFSEAELRFRKALEEVNSLKI